MSCPVQALPAARFSAHALNPQRTTRERALWDPSSTIASTQPEARITGSSWTATFLFESSEDPSDLRSEPRSPGRDEELGTPAQSPAQTPRRQATTPPPQPYRSPPRLLLSSTVLHEHNTRMSSFNTAAMKWVQPLGASGWEEGCLGALSGLGFPQRLREGAPSAACSPACTLRCSPCFPTISALRFNQRQPCSPGNPPALLPACRVPACKHAPRPCSLHAHMCAPRPMQDARHPHALGQQGQVPAHLPVWRVHRWGLGWWPFGGVEERSPCMQA